MKTKKTKKQKTIRFKVTNTSVTHLKVFGDKYHVQIILNGKERDGRYCRNMIEVNNYKREKTIYYSKKGYKVIK